LAGVTGLASHDATAQAFVAADYATNSTYGSGWNAGQNGGYGFGAWSFDGTNPSPTGQYQGIGSASALGTAWTLLTHSNNSGLANAGRAITEPGGLQPGQTLEVVMQNPTAYHFFRGWDICCYKGTNNNAGGVNTAAIRTQVFDYFASSWNIVDAAGSTQTPLTASVTGAAGMKFALTLTSANTYALVLVPLSAPSSAYAQTGTLASTNLPINWIDFRLYLGTSSGLNDSSNDFAISSMTISPLALNIQVAGTNAVLSWQWPTSAPPVFLASSPVLGAGTVWNTNNLPPPVLVDGLTGKNVVTNPISTAQQFYRLQQ
jgi:hypothetical protein